MSNSIFRRFSSLLTALVLGAGLLAAPVAALAQEKKTDEPKKEEKKNPDLAASVNPDDPAAVKVYMIDVRGDFGRDFSANALKLVLKDAKKVQPDIIIFRIDAAYVNRRGNGEGNMYDPGDANAALYSVTDAAAMGIQLIDDVNNDPEWKVKPRRVAWVNKAQGPSAFLPFFCKEIYFTSAGVQGGIGYLDFFFANMADEVVREKLRGAWLGHMEGLAIKGGHDYRVVRAMTRMDYELSYTMKGGKPEFFENRVEGENVLTDDGRDDRADSAEDVINGRDNDVLNLRSEVAKKISWSEGTADTFADLMYELGHSRAYRVYAETPRKILGEFASTISRQGRQFMTLNEEVERAWPRRDEGQTADDRNRNRGKIKRQLEEMNGILERYPEVAHRRGDPEQLQAQNKQRIAVLEQAIRLDRNTPNNNTRGR